MLEFNKRYLRTLIFTYKATRNVAYLRQARTLLNLINEYNDYTVMLKVA